MPLNHVQKLAIYRSLPKIVLHQREFGEHFYKRVFEEMPESREMFKTAIPIQHQRFMQTLIITINALDHPERFNKLATEMAEKHIRHHLEPHQYQALGVALMDSIAITLGDEFTEAMREAWEALYHALVTTMQEVTSKSK